MKIVQLFYVTNLFSYSSLREIMQSSGKWLRPSEPKKQKNQQGGMEAGHEYDH
jgi:hypothetical protein